MWLDKLDFDGVGEITATEYGEIRFINDVRDTLSLTEWSNKIVVLDFWHTACGSCFEAFPKLQYLYDKYGNNSEVALYAVNKPLENDNPNAVFNMLGERGYAFPVLLACGNTVNCLKIRVYPTVFVMDKAGKITYCGRIDDVEKKVDKLLSSEQP
jgi:thiol-disulfide isomerase/thioredoxin